MQEYNKNNYCKNSADNHVFQNRTDDYINIIALVHKRRKFQTCILIFELCKFFVKGFRNGCGCVVGLFIERKNNAAASVDACIGFIGVIRIIYIRNVFQGYCAKFIHSKVKKHKASDIINGIEFIAHTHKNFFAFIYNISCGHFKVLGKKNGRNGFKINRFAYVGCAKGFFHCDIYFFSVCFKLRFCCGYLFGRSRKLRRGGIKHIFRFCKLFLGFQLSGFEHGITLCKLRFRFEQLRIACVYFVKIHMACRNAHGNFRNRVAHGIGTVSVFRKSFVYIGKIISYGFKTGFDFFYSVYKRFVSAVFLAGHFIDNFVYLGKIYILVIINVILYCPQGSKACGKGNFALFKGCNAKACFDKFIISFIKLIKLIENFFFCLLKFPFCRCKFRFCAVKFAFAFCKLFFCFCFGFFKFFSALFNFKIAGIDCVFSAFKLFFRIIYCGIGLIKLFDDFHFYSVVKLFDFIFGNNKLHAAAYHTFGRNRRNAFHSFQLGHKGVFHKRGKLVFVHILHAYGNNSGCKHIRIYFEHYRSSHAVIPAGFQLTDGICDINGRNAKIRTFRKFQHNHRKVFCRSGRNIVYVIKPCHALFYGFCNGFFHLFRRSSHISGGYDYVRKIHTWKKIRSEL